MSIARRAGRGNYKIGLIHFLANPEPRFSIIRFSVGCVCSFPESLIILCHHLVVVIFVVLVAAK